MGEKYLRLTPSASGGDRDKRTGVIWAKSIPAKKFGAATIQRGANLKSDLRVGRKYQAQMEQKKKSE